MPRVSGWTWLNDPPLYHWAALAFGSALQPLMEFHSAARLASGVFMLGAFWLIYRATRDWADVPERHAAASAALLLLLAALAVRPRHLARALAGELVDEL